MPRNKKTAPTKRRRTAPKLTTPPPDTGGPSLLGARRANEMCECGHRGLCHVDGYQGCMYNGCKCIRFTWVPEKKAAGA